jgi:hypothetical protein
VRESPTLLFNLDPLSDKHLVLCILGFIQDSVESHDPPSDQPGGDDRQAATDEEQATAELVEGLLGGKEEVRREPVAGRRDYRYGRGPAGWYGQPCLALTLLRGSGQELRLTHIGYRDNSRLLVSRRGDDTGLPTDLQVETRCSTLTDETSAVSEPKGAAMENIRWVRTMISKQTPVYRTPTTSVMMIISTPPMLKTKGTICVARRSDISVRGTLLRHHDWLTMCNVFSLKCPALHPKPSVARKPKKKQGD